MKNRLLALLAVVAMVGAGCAAPAEPEGYAVQDDSPSVGVNDSVGVNEEGEFVEWQIDENGNKIEVPVVRPEPDPESEHPNFWVTSYGRQDCVGMENGNNNGEDLLDIIGAPEGLTRLLDIDAPVPETDVSDRSFATLNRLSYFSPETVQVLDDRIAENIGTEAAAYAFYACHLGEGVDLVSAVLWPTELPTDYFEQNYKRSVEPIRSFGDEQVLFVVQRNRIDTYPSSEIQLLSNTATGAETYPCTGELDGDTIVWTCFQGLYVEGGGSRMKDWYIPLNGGEVTTREYIETYGDSGTVTTL